MSEKLKMSNKEFVKLLGAMALLALFAGVSSSIGARIVRHLWPNPPMQVRHTYVVKYDDSGVGM